MQFHEQLPGSVWVSMNFWGWAWTWVVWVTAYRVFDMAEWITSHSTTGSWWKVSMFWNMLGVPTMYAVVFGVLPVLLLRSGVRLWKNR